MIRGKTIIINDTEIIISDTFKSFEKIKKIDTTKKEMLKLLILQGVTALITTNDPVGEFYQSFVIDDSKLQIPKNDALQDTVQVGCPENCFR